MSEYGLNGDRELSVKITTVCYSSHKIVTTRVEFKSNILDQSFCHAIGYLENISLTWFKDSMALVTLNCMGA